jgi:hypothetical protein
MVHMGGMDAARPEGVMTNLNRVLQRAAADHGERPAVRMDALVLSYARLWDAAGRMTSLLSSAGIVPGDRVAVMLPNVPAFPIAFYGALGAGAVVVPVNPLLKSREVACYLRDSGATVLLAWHTVAGEAGKGAAETGVGLGDEGEHVGAVVVEIDVPLFFLQGVIEDPESGERDFVLDDGIEEFLKDSLLLFARTRWVLNVSGRCRNERGAPAHIAGANDALRSG